MLNPILDESLETTSNDSTQWAIKHNCCCCGPYVDVYVPNKKPRHFLRQWEFRPTMPILVTFLAVYCLFVYFFAILPYQYTIIIQIISPFPILFSFVLFIWSYYAAVCMDPGFLPYNWINTQKFYYTWQEQLSGLAVTPAQKEFAKDQKNRPPHCSFSQTSGRYVVRADHICVWIENWVGKRNHKQFMLLNLWGFCYCFLLFGFNFAIKEDIFERKTHLLVLQLTGMGIEAMFGFITCSFFFICLYDLAKNRTKIQKMRGEKGDFSYRCIDSMQEVCGTGTKWLWCCPTPAFGKNLIITNDMPQIEDGSE
ncbi:hypothetical protein M9Y10_011597 [Tritrichomonas musculus]|uniref:Palmitoyltransferase n=1 Tax=Tritrichomonas musculus TaxID=1915356 RepID=A0ABR2IJP9_9EUKA